MLKETVYRREAAVRYAEQWAGSYAVVTDEMIVLHGDIVQLHVLSQSCSSGG